MTFIIRRLISMVITFFLITLISFLTIQLPPGDVVSNWVREQEALSGSRLPPEIAENLRQRFGYGEPILVQYYRWISGFPKGDFGFTILYGDAPVFDIVWPRIGMTYFIVIATLIISWGLAIPFGIYAATHKNTLLRLYSLLNGLYRHLRAEFSAGGYLSVYRRICLKYQLLRGFVLQRIRKCPLDFRPHH